MLFLIRDYKIYHFLSFLRREGKALSPGEWSMKIQGYLLKIRTILDIFDGGLHAVHVQDIDGHISTKGRMAACSHIPLQSLERTFAPTLLVVFPHSVQLHPDTVRLRIRERELCVRGYGAGEKAYFMGQFAQIIHPAPLIFPKEWLSSLEIHESGAQGVTVLQFLPYLLIAFGQRSLMVIDTAMLAAQITSVRDEDDALKRFLSAEKLSPEPP